MTEDLTLLLLRAIRGDIAELRSGVTELKERAGLIEGQCASISRRVERMGGDAELIKRRLDLAGADH